MPRYYFDTRDDDLFIEDDEGLDLPDLDAARAQAAKGLAEMAIDVLPSSIQRDMAVEVRDQRQLLLTTLLHFEAVVLA